jgi:ATP-binding cassette, subfamily B, bacterial
MLEPERSSTPWATQLLRAATFARPHAPAIVLVLSAGLLLSALGAVEPLVMKAIFDALSDGSALDKLLGTCLLLLGLKVLQEAIGGLSNWLSWRVRLSMQLSIKESTVTKLHALPVSYHLREPVGATMKRLDYAVDSAVGALLTIGTSVLPSLSYLGISLYIMFRLEWRLALVVLLLAPLPVLIGALATREQVTREKKLLGAWTQIYSRFTEILSGITTVKALGVERRETRRFLLETRRANALVARGIALDGITSGARNLAGSLGTLVALGFGGWLVLQGEVTVGTLIAFLGYIGGLFGPVNGLTGVYQTLRRATLAQDVIFDLLDARPEPQDRPDARPAPRFHGHVHLDAVTFGYSPEAPLFTGLSLSASPGETIALVGPSGAGKTTLVSLILRLHDVQRGAVRIDGHDVRSLTQRSLRRQIGVVLQDNLLFRGSVRENIAFGRPTASMEEVRAAASAANADSFIEAMEEGYDTDVGERGSRLSVGQRQRVAIARAILRDPAILILDEATSALDAESEAVVQSALQRLKAGRTTFVIAHRLATVVAADRICVIEEGRIVESGAHTELMRCGGRYAELVHFQTDGLIAA